MRIEIQVDKNCKEPKALIITDHVTEEVNELIQKLSNDDPQMFIGFWEDQAEPISPEKLIRVYAASGKVLQ